MAPKTVAGLRYDSSAEKEAQRWVARTSKQHGLPVLREWLDDHNVSHVIRSASGTKEHKTVEREVPVGS